jgi:glucose-1-phosphate thymidylyltransferase
MRGILLAGGAGTRLKPLTLVASKQLLPVYNKPMVYYPLSLLMLAGIRETLVITTPEEQPRFQALLGDGRRWGIELSYATQSAPRGIAEALLIGAGFARGEPVCLVLGDNILYGHDLTRLLRDAAAKPAGATVFCHPVRDPQRYGVVELDAAGRAMTLVEKPREPRSNLAVIGLYMLDGQAAAQAAAIQPSARGELEIIDLLGRYLAAGRLEVVELGRGFAWFDAGTPDSLLETAEFVRTVEHRQGLPIACLEEVAFRMGYIDRAQLRRLADELGDIDYGRYLPALLAQSR